MLERPFVKRSCSKLANERMSFLSTGSAFGFLQTNNSTTLIADVELIRTLGGAAQPSENRFNMQLICSVGEGVLADQNRRNCCQYDGVSKDRFDY